MSGITQILPGTGRGTMRSMVEGPRHASALHAELPLHPSAPLSGPPPRAGEEL